MGRLDVGFRHRQDIRARVGSSQRRRDSDLYYIRTTLRFGPSPISVRAIAAHQGFFTEEAVHAIADTTLENIRAFETGEGTLHRVPVPD